MLGSDRLFSHPFPEGSRQSARPETGISGMRPYLLHLTGCGPVLGRSIEGYYLE